MESESNRSGASLVSETRQAKIPAVVSVVGISFFFVAAVTLHILRADYDPARHVISHYAVGPYGFVMSAAFMGLGISCLALGVGLNRAFGTQGRPRSGVALLSVAGAAWLIVGIFPLSDVEALPLDIPPTGAGLIHAVAATIAFLCLIAASIAWSRRFRLDAPWRSFHQTALGLALASPVALFLVFAVYVLAPGVGGVFQKVFLVLILSWLLLTSLRLRSVAAVSSEKDRVGA